MKTQKLYALVGGAIILVLLTINSYSDYEMKKDLMELKREVKEVQNANSFELPKEDAEFFNEHSIKASDVLIQKEGSYLVYFYDDSCIDCLKQNQHLKNYQKTPNALKMYKVNLSEDKAAWKAYGIKNTPTIILIGIKEDRKQEIHRLEGLVDSLEVLPIVKVKEY